MFFFTTKKASCYLAAIKKIVWTLFFFSWDWTLLELFIEYLLLSLGIFCPFQSKSVSVEGFTTFHLGIAIFSMNLFWCLHFGETRRNVGRISYLLWIADCLFLEHRRWLGFVRIGVLYGLQLFCNFCSLSQVLSYLNLSGIHNYSPVGTVGQVSIQIVPSKLLIWKHTRSWLTLLAWLILSLNAFF